MPILRLLRGSPYGPQEIEIMVSAYKEALRLTGITDRTSAEAELMAMRVIDLFSFGEDNPQEIARYVAKESDKQNVVASHESQPDSSP